MRKPEEIVARIEKKQKEMLNFEPEVLMPYLKYEHAKPFLKEETTKEDWEKDLPQYTKKVILHEAKAYMAEYGWPKCEGHRGISASRTLQKMEAWAWLLAEDELVQQIEEMMRTSYAQYGAPVLKAICEHFDWPIPAGEAIERMMRGEPCGADYECGCGR